MNNLSKSYVNDQGVKETVIANSEDNYKVNLKQNQHYSLANYSEKKQNKFMKKFKNSIIGADIGVKSNGFSSVAILATVIAIAAVLALYFIWRF